MAKASSGSTPKSGAQDTLPKIWCIGVAPVPGGAVPLRVLVQGDKVLEAEILGEAKPKDSKTAANVGLLVLEASAVSQAEAVLEAKKAFVYQYVVPSLS